MTRSPYPPERPAIRKSDAKRKAMIAGACRVFLANGFGATSMNQVAAETGVSKMTLYRYFSSKEALLAGVVNDICDRIVDADVASAMERLPLREALAMFGHRMLETVFAPETLGLHRIIIAESYRFPELGKLFYESGPGSSIATLTAYFARQKENASLKIADPKQAAEEFMALLRGYEHMRALLGLEGVPSRRALKARVDRAVEHVLGPA